MGSRILFSGYNHGLQIGANYGSVTNEFSLPFDLDEKLSPAIGATSDSYEEQHGDQCLPGTRTEIICQIKDWALSSQGRCIFWLNGVAGTGKSTISRTMAKVFSESKSLGASFFFKRGEGDRGNARRFFPTIVRQLTSTIPQIMPFVQQKIRDSPDITKKAMREQFEKLLLEPLQSLAGSDIITRTIVIVVDALDECDGDNDIRLILQLLPQLQKLATVRLRVLLTSRPDLPIRLGFLKIANDAHKELILHEIPIEVIKHDIRVFFDHQLEEIRMERSLPPDWPGDRDLKKLVELSTPLFIFAATICRIFKDPAWDPINSLTDVLAHQYDQSNLDRTYLPVLHRITDTQVEKHKREIVSSFQQVIGAIVILESPLSVISLSKLLLLPKRLIRLRLDPLHSILKVPADETTPVRLFHLSFRDFLLDLETQKKTPLGIDQTRRHYRLAKRCLLMCQNLRKNICGLRDGTERVGIAHQTIHRQIPLELQYACRYWVHHLVNCTGSDHRKHVALLSLAWDFLQKHFLHWVEGMSLLGLTSEILSIIDRLQMAMPDNNFSSLSEFLHDAKRFILKNRYIVDQAPLQVYCAGLIFAPQAAIIRTQFQEELPTWLCQSPKVEKRWGALIQILEGHSDWIPSMAFSPDGRLLASGSHDKTVRLWDPVTGMLILTLKGHSDLVNSVAFSPDGQLLASGSNDSTVRLWDPVTGARIRMLECHSHSHSNSIISVAFSPDGILATASYKTVKLWDSTTGTCIHTLEDHSASVNSVAFSPDGQLLASGSNDSTIRLWNSLTGELTQALEVSASWVYSVAFSPTGLLASSSTDSTVWLWDPATCVLTETLKGHSDRVELIAFSPDSRLLASVSDDKTVRLWDPATGPLIHTLETDTSGIHSLVFSPDGRILALGSYDNTVRLWDLVTGALIHTLETDSSGIHSLVFSPDGLLSADFDETVRLWNPMTGALIRTLGAKESVSELNFYHDTHLCSVLDIDCRCSIPTFHASPASLSICVDGEWITLNDERVLWLPVEFRPHCFAVNGNVLALGQKSGRVSFIRFWL